MKKNLPSVSVIIPCYNAARFVTRAVTSVIQQSFRATQIICIDDGSEDGTLDVLRNLAAKVPIAMDIISIDHGGSAVARNLGLKYAKGEIIQFLDADDELLPPKLRDQLQLFTDNTDRADFVAGSFLRIRPHGLPRFGGPGFLDPWANLITGQLGITSANLWRRDAVLEAGGWNEKQTSSQEYELLFRLMQRNPSALLSHQPLTRKIDVPGNITNNSGKPSERRKQNILNYINLRRSMAGYLEAKGLMTDDILQHYHSKMHQTLKRLYPYGPDLAISIHKEAFPDGYRLPNTDGPGVLALQDLLNSTPPYPLPIRYE